MGAQRRPWAAFLRRPITLGDIADAVARALPRLLTGAVALISFDSEGAIAMKVLRMAAAEIGRGLVAGFVGTVAMTIASTIEMKLRGRPPSGAPAAAAGKVLGVQPRDEAGKRRFSNAVHFAYGTSWGLGRAAVGGLLCAFGVRRALAAPRRTFSCRVGERAGDAAGASGHAAAVALGREGDRDRRVPPRRLRHRDRRRVSRARPPLGTFRARVAFIATSHANDPLFVANYATDARGLVSTCGVAILRRNDLRVRARTRDGSVPLFPP